MGPQSPSKENRTGKILKKTHKTERRQRQFEGKVQQLRGAFFPWHNASEIRRAKTTV